MLRAATRAFVAAGLVALVALSLSRPHVHEGAARSHDAPCALCQLRSAEPAVEATLDVAPRAVSASDVVLPSGVPPVSGAPLGAVPGQSPPAPS
jgi:hypothetical protein